MKKGVYILSVILFLLGTASILAGFGVINIISSTHHLRYELGGALVDLLAISGAILVTVKNLKTKLQRISAYLRFGILEERKPKRTEPLLVALFLGFFGITAFALILWITPYGAGVHPDTIVYFGGAKSILSGKGFSINGNPITHFSPLYSLFLAATDLLARNLVQAARIQNACLFGINVGLISLAVYLTAGRNFLTTTCAVIFSLSSAYLLELHAWALSEPLFITFSLACIIFLYLYVCKPSLSLLIAVSLSMGFALVTRYIGIAFLPAVLIIVFVSGRDRHLKRRVWNTFICLILTCTPLMIFLARNVLVEGSATDRSFVYHPLTVLHYGKHLNEIVLNFIAPIALPVWAGPAFWGLIAVLLIVLLFILFKRRPSEDRWHSIDIMMPVSCLLFTVFYLLFLFISINFMDASTPVDKRLLSPIFCILIVGVFSAIWAVFKTLKSSLIWWGFLLCVTLSISIKMPEAIQTAAEIHNNGLGYTSRQWQNSESMALVKLLPDNVKIYSNAADIISFLTEKKSISIPNETFPVTREANSLYNEQINVMCKLIEEKVAILVYFNQITWRWYLPTQEEIVSTCKLPILQSFGDGIVFGEMSK